MQQETQKGFDQFQKITLNGAREHTESGYFYRYRQLEGFQGQDLVLLEGRFAPKDNPSKMVALFRAIIEDYERYQTRSNSKGRLLGPWPDVGHKRMHLRLVAHFIKELPKQDDGHYFRLRRKLARSARILVHLRHQIPKLEHYLVGADAAANELHAPPEVFAPIFRMLCKAGWRYFTYHAGEDYHHLISGIRAIHEAVVFLDLCNGNRIGHGTAVGIDPVLWLARSPAQTCLPSWTIWSSSTT